MRHSIEESGSKPGKRVLPNCSYCKTAMNTYHRKKLNVVRAGGTLEENQTKQGISALMKGRNPSMNRQVQYNVKGVRDGLRVVEDLHCIGACWVIQYLQ